MDVIVRMDARLWDTRDVSCTWDRTCGRTGTSSVKVRTRKHAVAGWQLICFDMLDVDPGTAYEVSAYIKTEGLTGRGATVGYLLPGEHLNLYFSEKQNPIPHFARTWVSGTTAWTRVGLTTKRPVEQGRGPWRDRKMQVALWHEGKGASWFDDVRIRKARHR
jgi:hypothetical protein